MKLSKLLFKIGLTGLFPLWVGLFAAIVLEGSDLITLTCFAVFVVCVGLVLQFPLLQIWTDL